MENKKFYRLMEINTFFYKFLGIELIRIQMSPVTFFDNEYSFAVTGDFINFIYPFSQEKLDYFLSNTENLIEIDLDDFVKRLEINSNGIASKFTHKIIENLRVKKSLWTKNSQVFLEIDNKTIGFKFTHFESALLYLKTPSTITKEFLPYEEIKTIEKEHLLILNTESIYFLEKTESGLRRIFNAKINNIEFDEEGTILKVKSKGYWALTNNVPITIDFNKDPLSVFNRSDKNAVITINFKENSMWQWSLINGEFLGKVIFNGAT